MSVKDRDLPLDRPAQCEALEERRLLSGVSLSRGGTLYIEGSRADDQISVTRDAADKSVVRVTVNGEDNTFRYGRVKRIVVSAGRGDDLCVVNKKIVKPALIQGGMGDDSIYGGGGDDSLLGHDGDDSCNGGAGDDSIVSGHGRDTLNGGDGDDSCKGGVGEDDSVRGGRGDDAYDDPNDVDDDDDNDRHRRRRGRGGGGDDDDNSVPGSGNDDDDGNNNGGGNSPDDDGTPDQGPGDN